MFATEVICLVWIASIPYVLTNICNNVNIDEDTLMLVTFPHSSPRGGLQAGLYLEDKKASSLSNCVFSCCEDSQCNVALFVKDKCLLVHCNASVSDGCEPERRDRFQNSFMITVRSLNETTVEETTRPPKRPTDLSCIYGLFMCYDHEACILPNSRKKQGTCQCKEGYSRAQTAGYCVRSVDTTPQAMPVTSTATPLDESPAHRPSDLTCIYGLFLCKHHEECVLSNDRRRQGVCQCVAGYRRQEVSGWCVNSTQTEYVNTSITDSERTNITSISTTAKPTRVEPTKPSLVALIVSAGKNKVIQLPENSVTLTAYVVPKPSEKEEYKYEWALVSLPKGSTGTMVGKNTARLLLSHLVSGIYAFKITVSSPGKYGEARVNVTVLSPTRKNKVPVAIIKPKVQKVKLPNTAILDGSGSTDDDKIVKYHWEEVSGPLNEHNVQGESSMLRLKDLTPGVYSFKLTVTDSDDVTSSAFANVTVIKDTDYPPRANAGSDVIISLPQNSLTLYGNSSTDDKSIESYEWIKKGGDKLTADVTGVRTPFLHLSKLQAGDYTFSLKVTDDTGQSATADVHVFVKPPHNQAPKADPGKDIVANIPTDTFFTLDGSGSSDDQLIVKYKWTQISGPSSLDIKDGDTAKATVSSLRIGDYQFQLTVYDKQDLQGTGIVKVTVKESINQRPISNAGGDQKITLPADLIVLDGSRSSDDRKIMSYLWTRTDDSLAVGTVLNHSDHSAIMQLTALVAGRYRFILHVTDEQGLAAEDKASIVIKADTHEKDLVELLLDSNTVEFKEKHKVDLINQLKIILSKTKEVDDVSIKIQNVEQDRTQGRLIVIFYAMNTVEGHTTFLPGVEVVAVLKKKLTSLNEVFGYKILNLGTYVCQNNCSGHGHCSRFTKVCICEAFWMENIFRTHLGDHESNCDWSILYVILISFILVVSLAGLLWATACCLRKCRTRRKKKKVPTATLR